MDAVNDFLIYLDGFLGSAICRQLLARGEQVTAYQRRPAPQLEAWGARVNSTRTRSF